MNNSQNPQNLYSNHELDELIKNQTDPFFSTNALLNPSFGTWSWTEQEKSFFGISDAPPIVEDERSASSTNDNHQEPEGPWAFEAPVAGSSAGPGPQFTCHRCGFKGHFVTQCPLNPGRPNYSKNQAYSIGIFICKTPTCGNVWRSFEACRDRPQYCKLCFQKVLPDQLFPMIAEQEARAALKLARRQQSKE